VTPIDVILDEEQAAIEASAAQFDLDVAQAKAKQRRRDAAIRNQARERLVAQAHADPAPADERSCFTCGHDRMRVTETRVAHECAPGLEQDSGVHDYWGLSGAGVTRDGMPVNRAAVCPKWTPKDRPSGEMIGARLDVPE
jgi:hypothetical protein